MAPRRTPAAAPATHFEQITVAEVQKIVRPGPPAVPPAKAGEDTGHFHGVQFYDHPDGLCRIVGTFLGEGLDDGGVAVLIVTPEHGAKIDSCLRERGLDVEELKRRGVIVTHDARATLDLMLVNGMPNPGVFRRTIGAILESARRGRQRCAIRAYGEMVDLLWKDGLEAAAIRLETHWNQLAGTHEFSLLCGYSMGNFYKGAALDEIKRQHSHVASGDEALRPIAQAGA